MKRSTVLFETLLLCLLVTLSYSRVVQESKQETGHQYGQQSLFKDDLETEVIPENIESEIPDSDTTGLGPSGVEVIGNGVDEVNEIGTNEIETNEINEEIIEEATTETVNEDDEAPINKYCTCTDVKCNCCRDFSLPLVPVRGPGCATIQYLGKEKMSVTLKYGDFVLASRTISSKNDQPVCLPLPGGFTTFCGRVYGISRQEENFKACLGLELRAEDEIEAALRVSCFKFGPKGLSMAEPEPITFENEDQKDEEEDDDDDIFGLGGDDDDADDDADDDDDDDDDEDSAEDAEEDDSADYTGFSFGGDIIDGIFGSDNSNKKKKQKQITVTKKPVATTKKPIKQSSYLSTAQLYQNKIDVDGIKTKVPILIPNKKKPEPEPENDAAEDYIETISSDEEDVKDDNLETEEEENEDAEEYQDEIEEQTILKNNKKQKYGFSNFFGLSRFFKYL